MGALSEFGGIADRAAAAFVAGCDYLCIGKQSDSLPEAVAAVEQSASDSRRDGAAARIERFRGALGRLKTESRARPRPMAEIAAAFREAIQITGGE
jgi:beta-glucosidase-like glycosyl hydrolase